MPDLDEGYAGYYADRIWRLIPEVYRANDSGDPAAAGPLRELVGRIAAQVAAVRRSIDRLWADQSIETSDDWVVPYIGDLLGTKLVNGLDPRGQRLAVAKTIHYRRRKGTLAVLEELARDVTGWDARVVEAFRRLARTRHSLDPPVGPGPFAAAIPAPCPEPGVPPGTPGVDELLRHEGLVGPFSGTPAGGFADLRSAHAARLAGTAFDEFFHTADLRRGEGATGRYGIPKLLVYLWRLESFAVELGTPVPVEGCPGEWVFDPTGRNVPLFLPAPPPPADDWTSAREWQVQGPLTQSLLAVLADPPYAASAGAPLEPVPVEVWPEVGRLRAEAAFAGGLRVSYCYGFPGAIGAGPYGRTLLGEPPQAVEPEAHVSGGAGLDAALTGTQGTGTVTVDDSLTYTAVADAGASSATIGSLLVRAGTQQRPVVRLPQGSAWTFTGGAGAELTLDGLLVSGGDVVLRGAFARVRLTACTADPGTANEAGDGFAASVDGRPLAPVRVWIEADPDAEPGAPGAIELLEIDHCVLGPVRTRNGGAVESLAASDSILQGLDPAGSPLAVYDPELLARALPAGSALAAHLRALLPAGAGVSDLDALVAGPSIYDPAAFAGVPLPPAVATLVAEGTAADTAALNLGLLESAFPVALAPAALALAAGAVGLERVTVLGDAYVHRLSASDSILAGFAVAEDAQDGCVRFSALGAGSSVASPYLSVSLAPGAALFTSTSFGEPGYGQLLETADRAIASGAAGATVTAGAETGSELGAFSAQLAPISERGLQLEYAEYMPIGLAPVVVHVT